MSFWLYELGPSFGEGGAGEAVGSIGTNAIPYIIEFLEAQDGRLKVTLAETWRRQSLIPFPFHMSEERQDCAFKALVVLGPKAKYAVADTVHLLDTPRLAGTATKALFAIGPDSIPALILACHHTNRSVRAQSAFVLAKLDTGRRQYTTEMIPSGHTKAIKRFGMTLGDDDIQGLTEALEDTQPGVRRASAEALLWLSGMARSAVPALRKRRDDEDPLVRAAVHEALISIHSDPMVTPGAK